MREFKPIILGERTAEWVVWRDGDIYYIRNRETGVTNCNIDLAKLINDAMELIPTRKETSE